MIKAVLFDFDNTLGDREEYAYRAYTDLVEEAFPDLSEEEKENYVQALMVFDQYGTDNKDYINERFRREFGVDLRENLNQWWNENFWRYTVLYDGVKELLRELRKEYRVGIVTNGHAEGQRQKLDRMGLYEEVDEVLISGAVGIHKPDPALFKLMAEKLRVQPEECVFVGDVFFTDIIGSLRAGMHPVWMWPFGKRRCRLDIPVIDDIRQIRDVLEEMKKKA